MHPVIPPQMAMMHGMMGNYGHGGLMGMPMMTHPMMGMPTMGTGHGPWNIGATAHSGGQTPVVHVYTRRRRMIEEGFYDGLAIQKCMVMEGVEICGTFYFGQEMVALDYTVQKGKTLRVEEEETHDLWIEGEDDMDIDDDDVEDEDDHYDGILSAHEEYEESRKLTIFGMDVNEVDNEIAIPHVDHVNTVWWQWTGHECNDHILSFMDASVCTEVEGDNVKIVVKYSDDEEEDDLRVTVGNKEDWDEVYHIHSPRQQLENVKMCTNDREIKLCAEMASSDVSSGKVQAMQISIEFV